MQKFKFITHDNTDAYFNLASEEYFLKQTDGYYFYLWINAPAVIVGANQNAIEEVNLPYTEKEGIKVVRRLTGGGAVYHDLGNLCYTVIAPFDSEADNYKEFTKPVIEYLNSLGVDAKFSGRNDITVDGKKISGNAQTVYKNRIMHHGTLLFSSDMSVLGNALNPSKIKMESKGIKSVRARVTNILDCLKDKIDIKEFKNGLKNKFLSFCEEYNLSDNDLEKINQLVIDKYSSYQWNIGSSPKGKNVFTKKFDFGIFTLNFNTEQGMMAEINITGDFFSKKDVSEFCQSLSGIKFQKSSLVVAFKSIGDYIAGANGDEIVNAIFS